MGKAGSVPCGRCKARTARFVLRPIGGGHEETTACSDCLSPVSGALLRLAGVQSVRTSFDWGGKRK